MVEILEEKEQLIVRIGGQEYTRYQFCPSRWKPYLYPLRAANGLSLLADAPTDHRHHHGLWVGHGRVDDADFWLERHTSGKILHVKFVKLDKSGETAGFTALNHWEAASGDVMLKETRSFIFYDEPTDGRSFDFELVMESPDSR